jgi:peptide chain release factor subunit 1
LILSRSQSWQPNFSSWTTNLSLQDLFWQVSASLISVVCIQHICLRSYVRNVFLGSADFKSELRQSDLFDNRLLKIVLKVVDVSYGGENGFNQAIELSAETLGNVKFIQEKDLICKYFDEISQDTGKYCFGVSDTMKALDLGAVETLIVWDNLETQYYTLKNNATNETSIKILTPEQSKDQSHFVDAATGTDLETIDQTSLVEWFANNYKSFGTTLEFVTNRSQEGSQFCKGFGGVGGLLRYFLPPSPLCMLFPPLPPSSKSSES